MDDLFVMNVPDTVNDIGERAADLAHNVASDALRVQDMVQGLLTRFHNQNVRKLIQLQV